MKSNTTNTLDSVSISTGTVLVADHEIQTSGSNIRDCSGIRGIESDIEIHLDEIVKDNAIRTFSTDAFVPYL